MIKFEEEDALTNQEKEELKKLNERIIDGYDKTLKRNKWLENKKYVVLF